MSKRPTTNEARQRLASEIAATGPGYANAAASVRAGYENFWITPALRAIDAALDQGREQED